MAVKEPSIDEVLQSIKQSTEARVNNEETINDDTDDIQNDDVLTLEDEALVLEDPLEGDDTAMVLEETAEVVAENHDNASLTADQSDEEMIDINAFAAEGKSETMSKAEAKSKVDQAIAELTSEDDSDPLAEIDAALSSKGDEAENTADSETGNADAEAEVSGDAELPTSTEDEPVETLTSEETAAVDESSEIDPAAEAETLMAEVAAEGDNLAYKAQEQTADVSAKPNGEEIAENADLAPKEETTPAESEVAETATVSTPNEEENNVEVDASAFADEMLSTESEEDTVKVEAEEQPEAEVVDEASSVNDTDIDALMETPAEVEGTPSEESLETQAESTERKPSRVNLPAQPTASGFQIAFPAEVLAEALRPLVQDWVAENLPGIVENLVQEELSRLKDS